MREYANVDPTFTPQKVRRRDASRLNLPCGNPTGTERLQRVSFGFPETATASADWMMTVT